MVNLCVWDWQAIATFATGFAAVGGAIFVAGKQNSILSRQVELERAKLRADLFERRLATYEIAADLLIHFGELPDGKDAAELRLARFAEKMRESQFLFQPSVYVGLIEIWDKANNHRVDRAISIANYNDGIALDPDRSGRIMAEIQWSMNRLNTLVDLFRPDLEISAAQLGIR
jgi:hypothetical protein